jgi:hydrogenase maturation factor HypF (carbamoyltransferase family)
LDTTYLLKFIYENRDRLSPRDLGYSAHAYLANGLAEIAAENALSTGIKVVGFSGGVAHNKILQNPKEEIEKGGSDSCYTKNSTWRWRNFCRSSLLYYE